MLIKINKQNRTLIFLIVITLIFLFFYSIYGIFFLKNQFSRPLINTKLESSSSKLYNSVLEVLPFYKKTKNHIFYKDSYYPLKEVIQSNYPNDDKIFYSNIHETFKRIYIFQNILENKFDTKFISIIVPDKFTANENIEQNFYKEIINLGKKNKINIFDLKDEIIDFNKKSNFKSYSKHGYHWSYGFLCKVFDEIYNFNSKDKFKFKIICENNILDHEKWSDGDLIKSLTSFTKQKKEKSLWPTIKTKPNLQEKIIVSGNSFSDQLIYFFQLIRIENEKKNNLIYINYSNNGKKILSRSKVPNDIINFEVSTEEKINLLKLSDRLISIDYLSDFGHLNKWFFKNEHNKSHQFDLQGLVQNLFNKVEENLNKSNKFEITNWVKNKNYYCSGHVKPMIIVNYENKILFNKNNLIKETIFNLTNEKKAKLLEFKRSENSNEICVQII